MDELKKSVRFVIPGMVFMIEFAVFLLFSPTHRKWVNDHAEGISGSLPALIGTAVTAVFASGAIGYLLSSLNHLVLTPLVFNYREFLVELLEQKLVRIVDQNGKEIATDVSLARVVGTRWSEFVSRRNWTIITAIWHSRREVSQKLKAATPRAESLADYCHGAGACFMGSILAFAFAWWADWRSDDSNHPTTWLFIWAAIAAFVHLAIYLPVARSTQGYVRLILLDDLRAISRDAEDSIRKRAYEIWVRDGCPAGRDKENWIAAENERRFTIVIDVT